MTQQDIDQVPAYCPNCQTQISRLNYIVYKSIEGSFTLDEGRDEELCKDEDGIEYSCPECDDNLFDDTETAVAFLQGKKVRPTLLEKSRAQRAEGGD